MLDFGNICNQNLNAIFTKIHLVYIILRNATLSESMLLNITRT